MIDFLEPLVITIACPASIFAQNPFFASFVLSDSFVLNKQMIESLLLMSPYSAQNPDLDFKLIDCSYIHISYLGGSDTSIDLLTDLADLFFSYGSRALGYFDATGNTDKQSFLDSYLGSCLDIVEFVQNWITEIEEEGKQDFNDLTIGALCDPIDWQKTAKRLLETKLGTFELDGFTHVYLKQLGD